MVKDQFGLVEVCPCDSVSFWLCQKSCSSRISKWTTCTECKSVTAACLMQSESEGKNVSDDVFVSECKLRGSVTERDKERQKTDRKQRDKTVK